ncbi:c-type cytochrome [Jeongeupia naejangsanensis]|uniref:Cytochrome c n=1 Tax=Jeongeupia naejangsanensis TaxID=613195 RepID=A0ABS2BNY7_9NEIS|nr:cytochrome c [Jeongeupia naejangsanensis]MBM3116768.1 cytochrome c [Jeongeupia naejangsanensis]
MKSLILFCCTAALLAGCSKSDPHSPSALRQSIFKDMLRTSETLGGMVRGRSAYDPATFQAGADKLKALASAPWSHFPEFEASGPSHASAGQFKAAAQKLETATTQLAAQAEAGASMEDIRPRFTAVEESCAACHRVFRPE